MFGNKFPQLSALKDKKADEVSAETLNKVNAELTLNGITAVQAVSVTEIESVTNQNTDLKNQVEALTAANQALSEKVTELEAMDGAEAVNVAKKEDKQPNVEEPVKVEDMPHMKAAKAFVGK